MNNVSSPASERPALRVGAARRFARPALESGRPGFLSHRGSGARPRSAIAHSSSQATASRTTARTFSVAQVASEFVISRIHFSSAFVRASTSVKPSPASPISSMAVDVGAHPSATFINRIEMGINMRQSFAGADRQPQATTGKDSQAGLPFLGLVSSPQLLSPDVVGRATFNGVLSEAARHSGMDDQDIAEALNICRGYMSRFMRGVAQQWAKRLVMFMRVTGSLAPLQWIADQLGCDVAVRAGNAARIRELESELQALKRA